MSKIYTPNPDYAKDAVINSMDAYWNLQNKAIENYEGRYES